MEKLSCEQILTMITSSQFNDIKEIIKRNNINGYCLMHISEDLKRATFPEFEQRVKFDQLINHLKTSIVDYAEHDTSRLLIFKRVDTSFTDLTNSISSSNSLINQINSVEQRLSQRIPEPASYAPSTSNYNPVDFYNTDDSENINTKQDEISSESENENLPIEKPKKKPWTGVFDFTEPNFTPILIKKLQKSNSKLDNSDLDEIVKALFNRLNEYELKDEGYPSNQQYSTVITVIVNEFKQLATFKDKMHTKLKNKYKTYRKKNFADSPIVKAKQKLYTTKRIRNRSSPTICNKNLMNNFNSSINN